MKRSVRLIKKAQNWLSSNVFPSFISSLLSSIIGLSFSLLIYLRFLQRHFFSRRYLFFAVCLFIFSAVVFGWINTNFLAEKISHLTKKKKPLLILLLFLITILLLFITSVQPVYYLVPDSELEISFSIPDSSEENGGVRLLWIHTGQGYVHRSAMTIDGEYEVKNSALNFSPGQQVNIRWVGKAGPESEIVFRSTPFNQEITLIWNGDTETINLMRESGGEIIYRASTAIPFIWRLPYIFSFIITVSYLIALITISVINYKEITEIFDNRMRQYNPQVVRLLILIFLVVLIYIFFSVRLHPQNSPYSYHFVREDGSITILSAAFLSTAGLLSIVSFIFCPFKNKHRKVFFFVMALALTYLTLDEVLHFHEMVGDRLDQTGFLKIIFTNTSIRRWNDLIIILYGVVALPALIYFLPIAFKTPYLGEFFILAFASYALHTAIDAVVEPPTVPSTIIEESFKLYAGLFLTIGSGAGLMSVMDSKSKRA